MASRNKGVLKGIVALGLILGWPTLSLATPQLRLSDGTNQVTITDQLVPGGYGGLGVGTASDANGAVGAVNWTGTVGAWTLNITTGTSNQSTNPATPQLVLSTNSQNPTTANPPDLTISFWDYGFTGSQPFGVNFTDSIGGTTPGAGGSVQYNTYLASAVEFSQITPIDSSGVLPGPAFNDNGAGFLNPGNPYGLTMVATIHHTGAGSLTSFTAFLNGAPASAIPEPSSLLLLGSGLVLACRYARRKRVE